ncbi:MAG: SAM-dependent methyltransferase, partial [Psychroserpens sp.]|nr:SAM-dependent methyltransferase [Psychroserpens sp.]
HLSNKEIQQILPKLKHFKYIILTEHIPEGDFTPNLDIISGQGTRLKQGSGVDVLEEPFSYKFKRSTEIFRVRLSKAKGVITTVLCIL